MRRPRLLVLLVVPAVLAACGDSGSAPPDEAAAADAVDGYLHAVSEGDGMRACSYLTEEAQLLVFDHRLVDVSANNPQRACARIVDRNRLQGERSARALRRVAVERVEVDGHAATAYLDGTEVRLRAEDGTWRIDRMGLGESVVPGRRALPKPRDTTF